ncbi:MULTISPECIES: 2-succinyl-5-enolpyruvyl-6-hydroxy-3-cyclohexene-1-carboxylic-acid synthase [unclassified Luteococcus]|uniref:2-succinyl-5-enolpyruvyl-6-hydroxy-3- cyclohexene-1-carboxylic-acid synthase n=1 Tax=unclassified Luteococcus TaxID=2639923 RepID=UPI00313EDA0E
MSSWLLAQCVVEQLRQAGVRHVVLAPGSRNAPLSLALHRASDPSTSSGIVGGPGSGIVGKPACGITGEAGSEPDDESGSGAVQELGSGTGEGSGPGGVEEGGSGNLGAARLRLHVRVDERSAGFLALGMAKALEEPVAVVTTSGTAVANLAPAVMEANQAGIALVVLSADRPLAMINSGANQTGNQYGLFAGQVRHQVQLTSDGEPPAWRFQLRHALALAAGTRTRNPGPVQVNLHLAEPLMPTEETLDAPGPWRLEPSRPGPAVRLDGGPRTVVLAGDARPAVGRRAVAVAESGAVPLLAEPTSNARTGRAVGSYRLLLGKDDLGGRIQRVIVFGHPTLSRPVTRLLRRPDVEVIMVADRAGWHDPGFTASAVVDDVDLVPAADRHWLNQWLTADLDLQTRIELVRRPAVGEDPVLTGHDVARLVTERTAGQVLVLGSSNPIRDADLAPIPDALYAAGAEPTLVHANRGLAGIDGVISTAAGIALALDRPTTCLLGDLTFLHDAGGLWLGTLEQRPRLRLVVVDDRGGSIFHGLEQGGDPYRDSFEKVFGTPHTVDLAQLAAAHGWATATVTDAEELGQRLRVPVRGPELLVIPVSRHGRRELGQRLANL